MLTRIDHIGIACFDLDATVEFYRATYGFEVFHTEVNEEQGVREAMLRINGTDDGGSSYIQLLEPVRADSTVAKWLDKNGEGVHHIAFGTADVDGAADTIGAAYELNAPELEAVPDVDPLVSLDLSAGLAVVDWIKLADDGSGDVVVRIFEAQGGRAAGRLRMCADRGHDAAVTETDLLERPVDSTADDLPRALHEGQLRLGPFQVATLRIQPSTPSPDVPPTRRSES
jgi:methylmalonyl-CoA epimerase